MRLIQLRSFLSYGDGICNTIIKMDEILSDKYSSIIAVKGYDVEYEQHPNLIVFNSIGELNIKEDDIVIYPFGEYDVLGRQLLSIKCKRILLYQNVTYPLFFSGVNDITALNCAKAQRYIRSVSECFLKAIAPSYFSCNELKTMNWREEDICYLPIPVSLEKQDIVRANRNEEKKLLFVGRVVPNKKYEDVIRIYNYYRINYSSKCSLKFVGSFSNDSYYEALQKYISINNIENVSFLGHVTDEELEELYLDSDIFICMSEHEGFCMPLIEAMSYELPVLAYNSTAVPDTMGEAGILVDTKDPTVVCRKIDEILSNEEYRNQLIATQNEHIKNFIRTDYKERLYSIIDEIDYITSYSYDDSGYQFYELLLQEIDSHRYDGLCEQLQRLHRMECSIVIYGVGKVGKELLRILEDSNVGYDAICDANKSGETLYDKTIMSPEQSVEEYPDAIYIITIQNKDIVDDILDRLNKMGVQKHKTLCYYNNDKRIGI